MWTLKKTILIVAEGYRDSLFLKYLKKQYERKSIISTKIINGHGGTADGLVKECIVYQGNYDQKITLLDNDKDESEMAHARRLAADNDIVLIECTPCLEAILLLILDEKFVSSSSTKAKQEFERKWLKGSDMEYEHLYKIFPKRLINEAKARVSILEDILDIMIKK